MRVYDRVNYRSMLPVLYIPSSNKLRNVFWGSLPLCNLITHLSLSIYTDHNHTSQVYSFQSGFMDMVPITLLRAPLFLRILLGFQACFSSLLSALKYLTVSEQGALQFYFSQGSTNNVVTQPIPCLTSRAPTEFYLLWNSQIPPHSSSLFLASLSFLGLPSLENASDIPILDDLFWAIFFCPRFVIFFSDLLQFS